MTTRGTVDHVEIDAVEFPTPGPEADGTLDWASTTAVTVRLAAAGTTGLGWTYSSPAAATVIARHLAPVVRERDVLDGTGCWEAMRRACRNLGTTGVVAHAISAVDIALWDLRARLLRSPLAELLGGRTTAAEVYGSGGFVNQTDDQLVDQVRRWQAAGCGAMKIKIGGRAGTDRDAERLRLVRETAGAQVDLMVDANGAFAPGRARRVGHLLDEMGVVWFEEPVSSDDIRGLRTVRDAVRCDVTAGEYVYDGYDATALLPAVDCLQLDVTRCGGYTGFLRCAALAAARGLPVSAHCAPSLHLPLATAVTGLRHLEWFLDHARLEPELVEGAPTVRAGRLHPGGDGLGHGMRLRTTPKPASSA